MSEGFKLPKHPRSGYQNPFENVRGQNPFSDGTNDLGTVKGVYDAPSGIDASREFSEDYEVTLEARGWRVCILGVLGFLVAICGLIGAIIAEVANYRAGEIWVIGFFPFTVFSMVFSFPAWHMGTSDLRAMMFGAMRKDRYRVTLWGARLGVIGISISILSGAFYFTRLVLAIVGTP